MLLQIAYVCHAVLRPWICAYGFPQDARLLNIYLAKVSLENTEIGCHIKIDSSPNIYETDAQAMIQFFEV